MKRSNSWRQVYRLDFINRVIILNPKALEIVMKQLVDIVETARIMLTLVLC